MSFWRVVYTKNGENCVKNFYSYESVDKWLAGAVDNLKKECTRVKVLEYFENNWYMRYHWQKTLE